MLIETYIEKMDTIGRFPKGNQVSCFQLLIDSLRPIGNLQIVLILNNIITDISVIYEICVYFDLLQELSTIFDFSSDLKISA